MAFMRDCLVTGNHCSTINDTGCVAMMIYFSPTLTTVMTPLKRARGLLLALSTCALVLGCDSHSTPFDESTVTKSSIQDTAKSSQENASAATDEADLESSDAGESLIASAKPSVRSNAKRAPMIAESDETSSMRATLIGDYVGMLPCDTCKSVEVTLNLFADSTVLKTSIYQNPETPKVPLVESGIYRQDNNEIIIVYSDQRIESYRIQNSHLVLLDDDKTPNTDYTLSLK